MAKGAKFGGRKKGVKNKKTQEVKEIVEAHLQGQSLPDRIMDLIEDAPADIRLVAYLKLMDYIYPKQKSIIITGEVKVVDPVLQRVMDMTPEERRLRLVQLNRKKA